MILKFILIFYFSLVAWKDYRYKEVSYFDVGAIFFISLLFLIKDSTSLTFIYITVSLLWFYIEVFYFKNREDLFFPMGIVDMFYLVIIFSLISTNFSPSSTYLLGFILSFTLTLIFSITKKENGKVPYLYALYPLMLFGLIFYPLK